MDTSEFEVAVGISRKWDAREAGREVARTAIEKLTRPPNFFLLFSTIHYEKHGGFQEFLDGVWDIIPQGTHLIGGTIAGFINKFGCYTRGATALAATYPNMDVAIGTGKNTKRSPRKAGRMASKKILQGLEKSLYSNKFLFVVISGPTLPKSKRYGTMKIVDDTKSSRVLSKLTNISTRVNQIGLGRETEVLNGLCEEMMDFSLLGVSSNDDNKYLNHYQFYNKEILKNSIVALGIKTDMKIFLKTSYGFISTGEKATITGTENWNYVVKSLDNKSAVKTYFEKTGISREIINEGNIHRITPFLPIGCYHKDGTLHPYPVASFLGDYLLFGHDTVSKEIEFLSATGKSLINAVDESIRALPELPNLLLVSSCAARLETLGKEVNRVREIIEKDVKENYLVLYGLGEERKECMKPPHLLQESFNVASFY
jgi:hypothetical protein